MVNIDYNQQMLDYYPEVIKAIREFQALILTESLQVEEMHEKLAQLLANAYVTDCDESTLAKWEKVLGIAANGSLSDRRETVLANLYNSPKLNSKSIADIVKIFTGADSAAISYFKDGTIYVEITPPKGNKQFKFENVERELRKKIPAHLNFEVTRNYNTWLEATEGHATWESVMNNFENWDAVVYDTNQQTRGVI